MRASGSHGHEWLCQRANGPFHPPNSPSAGIRCAPLHPTTGKKDRGRQSPWTARHQLTASANPGPRLLAMRQGASVRTSVRTAANSLIFFRASNDKLPSVDFILYLAGYDFFRFQGGEALAEAGDVREKNCGCGSFALAPWSSNERKLWKLSRFPAVAETRRVDSRLNLATGACSAKLGPGSSASLAK